MAQTTTTASASFAPSHLQAAETLLRLTSSAEAYNQGIDQKLAMMFKQFPDNPDREGTQKRMRAFMAQYLSWESILPELTNIYARHFNETELRDLISFYQTSTGKKLVTLLP